VPILCISFFNQRYFIGFLFHIWIGATYGNLYHFAYYLRTIESSCLSVFPYVNLAFPPLWLVLGYIGPYAFLISVFQIAAVLILICSSNVLYTQVSAIAKGQTQYERKHNIDVNDSGVLCNLRETLGQRWYLIWLFPTVESAIVSNKCFEQIQKQEVKHAL